VSLHGQGRNGHFPPASCVTWDILDMKPKETIASLYLEEITQNRAQRPWVFPHVFRETFFFRTWFLIFPNVEFGPVER
jgi:hypothetical protein